MRKFYITTPIYYVNDKPHIGHAYTTILADVLARYHRSSGDDVFFLTGLDEHGQKVQQAAEQRGLSPQQHADDLAPRFLQLWEKLGIQYNDFIRTTQERHKRIVQQAIQTMYDAGDIYPDEYEGWYSVAEERFITETEKESGQFRDIKKIKEKNWFFRMGKYQEKLIDHIQTHPEFILPSHRRNEILGFLRQPLGDLCVSRPKSRLSWGIEIPFAKDYVAYVWVDALLNYVTAPGYLHDEGRFARWWPATIHLIGKDILTTHTVYWPTMLFSLGLPLPRTIFAHGWWLMGETKMSKSLGNVVNPLDLIDQFGVDALRYYLMREMILGQDANFTLDSFIKRYNSDLANDYGNLLNRVSGLIQRIFGGVVPSFQMPSAAEKEIQQGAEEIKKKVPLLIEELRIHEAIEEVIQYVRAVNKFLEAQAPWKVAKDDIRRAGSVIYTATEALRMGTLLLEPVIPSKAKTVLDILGTAGSELNWGELKSGFPMKPHGALFPRLEKT